VNNFYEKALVSTENFWALMRNPFGIGFGNEALLDSKSRISRVSNECKV